MKKFLAIAALLCIPQLGVAQEANSNSASQAAVISNIQSGVFYNNSGKQQVEYQGSYKVENVPAVSAPAVFGGGHPCLAGRSGGISIVGGGLSYGQGEPEPACMAWVMGQPEAAIRIMAMTNPTFCKAMGQVGYVRIGNTTQEFACGKQPRFDRGSSRSAPVSAPTPRAPKERNYWTKCENAGGKVVIAYTSLGKQNKAAAQQACLSSLGY